jgi:uncharacterized protein (UPF0333 family)
MILSPHKKHSKLNQQGLGLVSIIVVVVVVLAAGSVGAYALHRDHDKQKVATISSKNTAPKSTSSKAASSSSTSTPNPYAGWKTYTSSIGGFSFQYPASWQLYGLQGQNPVAGSQINGTESTIENWEFPETTNTNNFTTYVTIASSPAGLALNPPVYSDGHVTTLSNGLRVWETNSSASSNPNCFTGAPTIMLVSNGNFYMQLSNGKYLSFQGDFCGGQKQQTTYSYQQQVSSQEWTDGKNILASFKF